MQNPGNWRVESLESLKAQEQLPSLGHKPRLRGLKIHCISLVPTGTSLFVTTAASLARG